MSETGHAFDVVVIGSGGAGLVAALRARDRGARVAVVEKTERIGGTTAVSGGVLWIPGNHRMADVGGEDSREDALAYLRRVAFGQSTEDLLTAFVDSAPDMIRYLERRTPLRFAAVRRPDYHPEFAGGKLAGRTLDIEPIDANQLGARRALLRTSPHYPPITYRERYAWGRPEKFDWGLIGERVARGTVTLGAALVAGLLKACLDAGVEVFVGMRARRLVRRSERVVGVQTTDPAGRPVAFDAARAVVVASGGFEWNREMEKHFLRGPELAPATTPSNTGDGILMGAGVGASLGNMNEAAWCPMVRIPGEEYDGHPVSRLIVEERSRPGSIIVNRRGRRFVNEATSYNSIVRSFHVFDPEAYDWANLPAYLVFDQRFRSRYNVATVMPADPTPAWMTTADTLEALARALSIDPRALEETVERFNTFAAKGTDPAFRRGESAHDRFNGDAEHGPNPCLGPLDAPPFFAVQLFPGTVGTKGGLRCDPSARVLDVEDAVIPGLYACGSAMASCMGIGYPSAGGMLGSGLTFGYIAGDAAGQECP
jgi:succinate dehydrogenase/fumarate reductase flavoprotein subunit